MLQDYIHYNIGAGIGKLTDTFFLKQRLEYEYNPKIDITNNVVHASPLRGERIFGRALARKVEVRRYSADTPNNPRQAGRSPDEGGYEYVNSYFGIATSLSFFAMTHY